MAARRRKGRKPARSARPARPKRRRVLRPARKQAAARKRTPRAAPPRAVAAQRLVAGVPIEVGVVRHYFPRAAAAVVELCRPLRVGDTIHVRGHTTDFMQQVSGLALDGAAVREGAPPQSLGLRLEARARPGDRVYRVSW
jgi:putative protease